MAAKKASISAGVKQRVEQVQAGGPATEMHCKTSPSTLSSTTQCTHKTVYAYAVLKPPFAAINMSPILLQEVLEQEAFTQQHEASRAFQGHLKKWKWRLLPNHRIQRRHHR